MCRRLVDDFEVVVLTSRAPGAAAHEWLDGVEVVRHAYAPARLETLVYGGGIVTHLRRNRWKWLLVPGFIVGQWLAARRLARERSIDMVHAHWLLPQGLVAWLLRREGLVRAYAVTSHGADVYGLRGRVATACKALVARDAAAFSVVSSGLRDAARRAALGDPTVLPMGADLVTRFTPDPSVARAASDIVFVGRLVEKKGLRHLLDALPEVRRHHPGATLDVVGFGPELGALRERVEQLGLASAVRFRGPISQADLPELLRRAALLVAPSVIAASGDAEGLPVVLMEAAGCACPVLTTDLPGMRDLFGPDADTMLVQPGDPLALAAGIRRVLDRPDLAAQRAARLRERCVDLLDWGVIARRYGDWLMGAVESPLPVRD